MICRNMRKGPKVQVISRQIAGRAFRRPPDLRGLQGRLDDTGDADGDLVLQLEHVFERAVEAIGLKMGAGLRFDQLSGNADARAGLSHGTFEQITDP